MEAEASVDLGETDATPSNVVAPNYNTETDDALRKRIEEVGNEVLQKYCSKRPNEPTMLPPIPNCSKFIDKYINPDEELTNENKDDKRQQEDYGAEVIVYRALESFKRKDMIVLHGLKQTNRQYSLFTGDKFKEEYTNRVNGQCDLLVISQEAITIIEVCNLSSKSTDKQIRGNFKGKKIQGERAEKLVKGILKHFDENDTVSDPCIPIRWFFACPNLARNDFPKDNYSTEEMSRFMFKEDIEVLHHWTKSWWAKNVMTTAFSDKTQHLSKILIGLWTIDSQNQYEIEKDCSLGGNILKTDKLLRNADITFGFGRKNNRGEIMLEFENPNFVPAHVIFQKMQIKYLSKKQNEVFMSQEKFMWINGPAGSGKTILTLGKVIQTVRDDQKENDKKAKAVIFVNVDEDKGKDVYQNTLREAGIQPKVMHFKSEDASSLTSMSNTNIKEFIKKQGKIICSHLNESVQVVLFDMTAYPTKSARGLAEGLSFIKEIVLSIMSERKAFTKFFVDDEQYLLNTVKRRETVDELKKITKDNEYCEVWICSDKAQSAYPTEHQLVKPSTSEVPGKTQSEVPGITPSEVPGNTPSEVSGITPSEVPGNTPSEVPGNTPSEVSGNTPSEILGITPSEYVEELYSGGTCLTENFRNTLDIANILSAIRNKIPWSKKIEQTAGHFIRGPRPTIHFFYASKNLDLISGKLKEEVDRLVCGDAIKASDIGLICNNIESGREIIEQSKINEDINIPSHFKAIQLLSDTNSVEWPAVICLMEARQGFYDQMSHLPPEFYHAISRGRVFVTVLWYYSPYTHNQPPQHVRLLKDLYPLADIKEWGDPEERDKIRKKHEQKRIKDNKRCVEEAISRSNQ